MDKKQVKKPVVTIKTEAEFKKYNQIETEKRIRTQTISIEIIARAEYIAHFANESQKKLVNIKMESLIEKENLKKLKTSIFVNILNQYIQTAAADPNMSLAKLEQANKEIKRIYDIAFNNAVKIQFAEYDKNFNHKGNK